MYLNISKEFSDTPGGRLKSEGPYSGEEFRERLLEKRFKEAKENGVKLTIDLDGGYGYPPSFLEEAFGGLSRIYGADPVLNTLDFISNDEPSLVGEIKNYIKNAGMKKP